MGDDVGGDDEFVAGDDAAFAAEEGDGVFDRDVGLGGERHQDRRHAAEEAELAEHLGRRSEGNDGGVDWAQHREALRHEAVAREREEL